MKKQTKLFKEKKKKKMKKVKKKIKIKKNCRSIVTKNKEKERSEPLERCASGRRRWRQNKQTKKVNKRTKVFAIGIQIRFLWMRKMNNKTQNTHWSKKKFFVFVFVFYFCYIFVVEN